jgi:hypothetical protein
MRILVDCGKGIRPWHDGPIVRAVEIDMVRQEFYRAYPAAEATDEKSKAEARRKAFRRAINDARERDIVCTRDIEGVTWIWLVSQAPTATQGEMPV